MKLPRISITMIFRPVRSLATGVMGVLDVFLDEVYWRFDLWSVVPSDTVRGVADYSKVRGFCAFWIAVGLDVWFFVRTATMPVVVALLTPIALLAYSMGERVFIAFIKALPQIIGNWKSRALGVSVPFTPHEWATGVADAGVM